MIADKLFRIKSLKVIKKKNLMENFSFFRCLCVAAVWKLGRNKKWKESRLHFYKLNKYRNTYKKIVLIISPISPMFIGLELISHTSLSTQAFPSKPNLKENITVCWKYMQTPFFGNLWFILRDWNWNYNFNSIFDFDSQVHNITFKSFVWTRSINYIYQCF